MASTRYTQQPPQIYQDPVTSYDSAPMPSTKNPSNPKKPSPLRTIKNASSKRNIVFNPPQNGPNKHSPLKSHNQMSNSSPSRAPLGNKFNMISMPPPGASHYNTDSIKKKQQFQSKYKSAPQKALFTTFMNSQPQGKENYPMPIYNQQQNHYRDDFSSSNFSLEGLYSQKPAPKRSLMEAAPIQEAKPFKKQSKAEEGSDALELRDLPEPDSFPPIHDDGFKPAHSYAQLIGMSILRARNRRLTLAQIYKWISDTYSFYGANDAGWQNSIRHNLSLNKAFIKQERPKDDPGKGNYWVIQPGMEFQFIKEKPTRKPAGPNENLPVLNTALTPIEQQSETPQPMFKDLPSSSQDISLPKATNNLPEPELPPIPELSSDATIPASEFNQEGEDVEETPSSPQIQSSPPAMMHSSPPVARHTSRRHATPPPVPRFSASSQTRSHKRKFASMDDSGYFSSLESSAMRPHAVGRLLTSEADRPRIKRGRAEEEIARLRGSSYDSPSKGRALSGFAPASSSPMRRALAPASSQMLPPLTPAVKLKAPVRPPPSVSPNTNLRLHRDRVRELVGSPVRGLTVLEEHLPWSPAFNLDETQYNMFAGSFDPDFDIFADATAFPAPGNGSPEKRSAKRPRLDRSRSANILTEASSSSLNKSVTSTPMLKLTPSAFLSPTKGGLEFMNSPSRPSNSPLKLHAPVLNLCAFDLPHEEFFNSEFVTEDLSDCPGFDITQRFPKIGSGAQASRNNPSKIPRPAMGRSSTTRF